MICFNLALKIHELLDNFFVASWNSPQLTIFQDKKCRKIFTKLLGKYLKLRNLKIHFCDCATIKSTI